MTRVTYLAFATLLCLFAAGEASAQAPAPRAAGEGMAGMPGMVMPKAPDCPDAALSCASTATPVFAPDGTLLLAWASGGRIAVARSADLGARFDAPVFVNQAPETLDSGPDSRPAIAVAKDGTITVAYAIFKDRAYNGEVRIARSQPDGSFSQPSKITADDTSQRFVTMGFDPDGRLFATWLDKRNRVAGGARNPDYVGAGLAWAWARPDGSGFEEARIAHDNVCECCRVGLGFAGAGRPVLLFRNIFEGSMRDHATIGFVDANTPGELHRVSVDNWMLKACPHHGPSLAVDAAGTWHAAWFTQGAVRKGVFYANSHDQGASFTEPMKLGGPEMQAGRPNLLAVGTHVYLAWKQFDGTSSSIHLMVSSDGGAHFEPERIVVQAEGSADHPILVARGEAVFLSWLTQSQGYHLVGLGGQS